MKRRRWLWVLFAISLLVAVPLAITAFHSWEDKRDYQHQIRMAQQDGLPTSGAEYAAQIRKAEPSENSAPLYRQLSSTMRRPLPDFNKLHLALTFRPTRAAVAEPTDAVQKYAKALRIPDQAAKLPRCWFDRDWSMGEAVLFPEFADIKDVAKLLVLRGSVAAHNGDVEDAIEDAQTIQIMALHVREEPNEIARFVSDALFGISMRALASWTYVHRDRPEYRLALLASIDRFPKPNVKEESSSWLLDVLSCIDLCATKEGRQLLGLTDEDISSSAEKIFPLLLSQSKARIKIVAAMRRAWAALDKPPKERLPLLEAAFFDLYQAILAFPTAASVYVRLGATEDAKFVAHRELNWEAGRQHYTAVARALAGKEIARSIDTRDLKSPFDGKPLSYKFDGEQIVLSVSGHVRSGGPSSGDEPILFKLPPDKL
jgi:hypothetical protein